MTKISFQLTDDSKLPFILNWLSNLGVAEDIKTETSTLTPRQLQMKHDLEASLDWVERHQRGEVKGKPVDDLLKELEEICKE